MKGRTYRYFQGEPLWPFGYGLNYTSFGYSDLSLSGATINAAYSPLRMARNYGFMRVDVPHDKLDVELIAIINLRDRSLLARATLSLRVRANVSIYAIDTEFAGARGSELSYMQVRRVTTAGARYYF